MFKNVILLNESLKQPLKTLSSEMPLDEFIEFFGELYENAKDIMYEWSVNYDNPEWNPANERPVLTLIQIIDKEEKFSLVKFHSIYPSFGTLLLVFNAENSTVKVSMVYGVEDFWENEVCHDCFSSLMGCGEEQEQTEPVVKLISTYTVIQHDPSRDNTFSAQACDCCGSKLGGNRYFLICMKGE